MSTPGRTLRGKVAGQIATHGAGLVDPLIRQAPEQFGVQCKVTTNKGERLWQRNRRPQLKLLNPKDSEDARDYEAESAFDTIARAEEHKADPKMMARVKKHAGRKLKAMKGLHEIMGVQEDEATEKAGSFYR